MIDEHQYADLIGRTVTDSNGDKIGTVGQVFLDDETGRAEWVTVKTGLFGTKESFIPLEQADLREDALVVPVDKQQVKGAPTVGEQGHLTPEDEQELYRCYDREQSEYDDDDDDDDAMTVSEERLRVDNERVEIGRARLRKYIVTENVTQTVPVKREKVRIEREPITDENRDEALTGPELSESEHEIVLTEERPVVTTETVPVERVRLTTEQEHDQETVSGTVRKEKVDDSDI